ncbi:MAG: hypothetical protein JWM18_4129 [Chloroflexi bacterium]|jgi:hypothetical protein|nr:hypothetical protein [Chloroflexota bacterium]
MTNGLTPASHRSKGMAAADAAETLALVRSRSRAAAGLSGQPRRRSVEGTRPAPASLDSYEDAASPAVSTAGPGVPSTPASGTTT